MEKKETKSIMLRLVSILGLDDQRYGFDGFFFREQVFHSLTKEVISTVLLTKQNWSSIQAYEYFLLPIISKNSSNHWTLSTIYKTLASSCLEESLKRNYYEKAFKHHMLAKLNGVKDVNGVTKYYAKVLTRESCCKLCKHFCKDEIFEFGELLDKLPPIVRLCDHAESCHASISAMTEYHYNEILRRRKH